MSSPSTLLVLYLVVVLWLEGVVVVAADVTTTTSPSFVACHDEDDLVSSSSNYPPDEAYEIAGLSTYRFTTIQPFLTLQRHWENYNGMNSNSDGVDSSTAAAVESYDPSVYCGNSDPVLYLPETIHWYLHYYVPQNDTSLHDTAGDDDTILLPPMIYMSPPNIVIPYTTNKNDQQDHLSFRYNMSYSTNGSSSNSGATTTSGNSTTASSEIETTTTTTATMKVAVHIYLPTPNSIGTRGSRKEQFPSSNGRDILLMTPEYSNSVGGSSSSPSGFYDSTTFKIGSNTNIVHVINDSNRSLRIHDRSHNNDIHNDDTTAASVAATPRNRIYVQKKYDPTSVPTLCIGGTRGADIEYNAYGTNTYCHIETYVVDNNNSTSSTSTSINSNCSSLYLSQQPIRSYNKVHTSGINNTIYMSIVSSSSVSSSNSSSNTNDNIFSSSSSSSSSATTTADIPRVKEIHRIQGELYGNDGTLIVDNVQLATQDDDDGNYGYHITDLEMPHGVRNNMITLYYYSDEDGVAADDNDDGIEGNEEVQLSQPEIGVNVGTEYYYCQVMDNPALSPLYDDENAQYFDYYAFGNFCHLFAKDVNDFGGTDDSDNNNNGNAGTLEGGGSSCFDEFTTTTKFVRHDPCYSGGGGTNQGGYYEGGEYYEGPFNGDDEVYGNNGWATSGESQSSSHISIVGIIMITLLSLVIVGVCGCLVCVALRRIHYHRHRNNNDNIRGNNWNTKNSNSGTNPSIENPTSNQNQQAPPPEAGEDPQEEGLQQHQQQPSESLQPSSSLVIEQHPMTTTSPPQQTEIPMVAAMPMPIEDMSRSAIPHVQEGTVTATTIPVSSPPIVNAVLLGDDEK